MIWGLLFLFLGLTSARKREYVGPEHLNHLRATGEHEEFARLLGIDVSLVHIDSEERSEGSIFNHASPYGDFILPEKDEEEERQIVNFDRWSYNKWPNAKIPVVFAKDWSQDELNIIIPALRDWNKDVENVKIVDHNGEDDYVYVFSGNGCYAYFGRNGGQQALSLQRNGCLNKGTVQHEFMHTAGIAHEHNRQDRDDHVEVLWHNIPEDWHSQYEKCNPRDFYTIHDYCCASVMHYPIWSPGTGKDAFKLKMDDFDPKDLGQTVGMEQCDIDKLNYLYRKR